MIEHIQKVKVYAVPNVESEKGYVMEIIPERFWYCMDDDSIALGEHEVSVMVDIPNEQELILKAIDTLQEKQKRIKAQAERDCQRLQAKINDLKRLEYKPYAEVIEA